MIVTCEAGHTELYDLGNDPSERINLADRKGVLVADLKHRLLLQMAKQSHEPKLTCESLAALTKARSAMDVARN